MIKLPFAPEGDIWSRAKPRYPEKEAGIAARARARARLNRRRRELRGKSRWGRLLNWLGV